MMSVQKIMIFALVAAILVIAVKAASDDSKCRALAKASGMTDEELAKVGPFHMYGMTRRGCKSQCNSRFMQVALEYTGGQACCCAAKHLSFETTTADQ